MKVISGIYKGKKIASISSNKTRPMMAIVRESIFNSLQIEIQNTKVLDLFSGSGSLGIEAISRGAKSCVFVEISKPAVEVIEFNLNNLQEKQEVIKADAEKWIINSRSKFSIVFIDPPYKYPSSKLVNIIKNCVDILQDNGKIIIHRNSISQRLNAINKLDLVKESKFGQSVITVYRKEKL